MQKCDNCGAEKGAKGARDLRGNWHDEDSIDGMNSSEGFGLFGDYPNIITIKLIKTDTEEGTKRLCQKCNSPYKTKKQQVKKYQNSLFPIQAKTLL